MFEFGQVDDSLAYCWSMQETALGWLGWARVVHLFRALEAVADVAVGSVGL
jgi:hypothetical protein